MSWSVTALDQCDNSVWKQWAKLCDKHHAGNPMLDVRFVSQLIHYFPEQVYVAVATDDTGAAKAIMMLRYCGKALWQTYKPSQAQISLLVCDPNYIPCITSLINALPHYCLKLDFLSLDPREHQSFITPIDSSLVSEAACNMVVDVSGDFETYWSKRNKNLKKNIRRYLNRLDGETDYQLRVKTTPEAITLGVAQYGMIESRGWKGKIGTAIHPGNVQGKFYESLLLDFAKQEKSVVFELEVDGSVVASRLCTFSDDFLIILKTTFEESHKRFAVGRVLLFMVLEYVFEHKVSRVVDFYTNASKDQLEWSTDTRKIINASCYRYDWLGKLVPVIKGIKNKVTGR